MSYAYYPGCALTGFAAGYDRSARAVMAALGHPLEELNDWTCCGAGATSAVDPHLTVALSARNLALAEAEGKDVLTACTACYTNLRKARTIITGGTPAGRVAREALAETGRAVSGQAQVKHLLQVLRDEVGLEAVKGRVALPLKGLRVAAYYGCQLGRPAGGAVDAEIPTDLDDLALALGARTVAWKGKTHCCGGATVITKEELALELIDHLLTSAETAGAQVIVTACPMCHLNLDVYQPRVNEVRVRSHRVPVLYFTQLIGVAMGLPARDLGLNAAFIAPDIALAPFMEGVAQ